MKLLPSFILGFFLVLIYFSPLRAQEAAPAPYRPLPPTPDANPIPVATPSPPSVPVNSPPVADTSAPPIDTNSISASQAPTGQAPDDVIKKLSDLTHTGKYSEAQQMTVGLLAAYPDDQRLIKAKAILDKLLTATTPTDATPNDSQPANSVVQPATSVTSEQLTGMDKIDYNALIQRAKEAQQTTDLDQQKILLKQFMEDSGEFLQKYPDQMLLWQFRAVSAIILDDMTDGYEAGQKLLAAGAVDSNDPNLQQLLAQLKNKGWLDKEKMDEYKIFEDKEKKFGWILGTWNALWSWKPCSGTSNPTVSQSRNKEEFFLTDSNIEGCVIRDDGSRSQPDLRGDILESGEVKWQCYLPPSDSDDQYTFRTTGGGWRELDAKAAKGSHGMLHWWFSPENVGDGPFYPSGWQPVISCENDLRTGIMKIVIPAQNANPSSSEPLKRPVTLVFTKTGDSQNQQAQPQ